MIDTTVIRTLLFADVRDSVSLYEQHGDREASRLILDLVERFTRTVTNFDGEVVKQTGDGIMAVFEWPDRGLLASSAMIALADERKVGVGIGLDHGAAITRNGDFFGNTVNVAARIMGLAHAGEILMTETVVEQLSPSSRGLIRLIDRASIKGLSKPANIYSLVTFDDNATIMSGMASSIIAVQLGLTLTHGEQVICFSPRLGRLEIGRLADRDVTVLGEHVSRNHATISFSAERYMITDHSTNGTFVAAATGECLSLRRSSAPLMASGSIGFGRPPDPGYEAVIQFKVEPLSPTHPDEATL